MKTLVLILVVVVVLSAVNTTAAAFHAKLNCGDLKGYDVLKKIQLQIPWFQKNVIIIPPRMVLELKNITKPINGTCVYFLKNNNNNNQTTGIDDAKIIENNGCSPLQFYNNGNDTAATPQFACQIFVIDQNKITVDLERGTKSGGTFTEYVKHYGICNARRVFNNRYHFTYIFPNIPSIVEGTWRAVIARESEILFEESCTFLSQRENAVKLADSIINFSSFINDLPTNLQNWTQTTLEEEEV